MMTSIFDLPLRVRHLSKNKQKLFNSIFYIHKDEIPLSYSSVYSKQHLADKFRTTPEIVSSRKTLIVTNRIFGEQTLFNPLRSNRPYQRITDMHQISSDCDFCEASEKTPADVFGRIETENVITAANAAAYSGLHGLIIPKKIHSLSDITKDLIIEMLDVAGLWFGKINKRYPKAIFPALIWNSSAKAGASVYHPHLQVMLTEKPYLKLLQIYTNVCLYKKSYQKAFFPEFTSILNDLGLVIQKKESLLIANLTPVKENELLLYSNDKSLPKKDIADVFFYWYNTLAFTNFNMAIYMPPLTDIWPDFYPLMRIVDRGFAQTSDIGAMELFYAAVVSSDPFRLIKKLQ
jgi:hypothetical protein